MSYAENKPLQIAIDGPAGAGKSSVAKVLARRLGCIYLDTGAMYRAVTWLALQKQVAFDDMEGIKDLLQTIELEFKDVDGMQHLYCNGTDVTEAIRTPEISANVSAVSMIPQVREAMTAQQQKIAAGSDVLMDGRDIGTTVLPNARYKFFLTASLEERARRRALELEQKGIAVDMEQLIADIALRDKKDSEREVSPLKQAEDAVLIDTSSLTFDEVVENLFMRIKK
ncbi:MAG: (d)CMP kinase [Peptococcaceae bacterium]|jgi:cytidylate kinase|nr:(d)CMP kinase [Peptococcaceae bacterium]MBQ2035010.1 (d)CMP kinase [Peptococcaceae bacterium]MBQ2119666.1 (d)CMP kinase [Peptococcaceae bacterium]MBQ5652605.1 (d)CMP kinase [Peptococcaceae bacterium]MBQ5857802.1 (d)CMP kinase [Peptococcaceae bacterium]